MVLRCPPFELSAALRSFAPEETGLVFVADPANGDDWTDISAELADVFRFTKQSLAAGLPVVFLVHNDDLLGRNGPGRAMVATGLLSAARSAAVEHRKDRVPVNVIAYQEGTDHELIARWCGLLMEKEGPTGDLIHLGSDHLGKALP